MIEILNQNLNPGKKITVLDKNTLNQMLFFAYDKLTQDYSEQRQLLKEWLFQSIRVCQENVDKYYFYSKEEFIQFYLQELSAASDQGNLGQEFIAKLGEYLL